MILETSILSVIVFSGVILFLVFLLSIAEKKLLPQGDVKILINGENMIDNIKAQLKDAMFSKDKTRITALRNFIAKLKAKEIDKKESISDAESLKVLKQMAKQLKDSIDQYTKGGRTDLADNEKTELNILNEFLPTPLSEEEMSKISGS